MATISTTLTPASLSEIPNPAPPPRVPSKLAETGLAPDLVEHLFIKTLYAGEATGLVVSDHMRLPFAMIEPIIERVRSERLVEVRGATGSGTAVGYRYNLTDAGRDRARQYLDANQ